MSSCMFKNWWNHFDIKILESMVMLILPALFLKRIFTIIVDMIYIILIKLLWEKFNFHRLTSISFYSILLFHFYHCKFSIIVFLLLFFYCISIIASIIAKYRTIKFNTTRISVLVIAAFKISHKYLLPFN